MDALDKARAALDAAKKLDADHPDPDQRGLRQLHIHEQWSDLLSIARVQAEIATAEALEKIADHLRLMAYGEVRH